MSINDLFSWILANLNYILVAFSDGSKWLKSSGAQIIIFSPLKSDCVEVAVTVEFQCFHYEEVAINLLALSLAQRL